jgi:hypothetical protein
MKGTAAESRRFDIACKLAATETGDSSAPFSTGIPTWLKGYYEHQRGCIKPSALPCNYYFMYLREASPKNRLRRPSFLGLRMYGPRCLECIPLPNLILGPLLGRGGDGKVFRGMYCGDLVAVKVSELMLATLAWN